MRPLGYDYNSSSPFITKWCWLRFVYKAVTNGKGTDFWLSVLTVLKFLYKIKDVKLVHALSETTPLLPSPDDASIFEKV